MIIIPKTNGTITFIIKNISNYILNIFNLPIAPNQVVDLMQLTNVSEDLIKKSLLKGELYYKFKAQQIQLISNEIVFNTSDPDFQSFLNSIGILVNSVDIFNNKIGDDQIIDTSNIGKLNNSVIIVKPTGVSSIDTATLLAAISDANGIADVIISGGTCVINTITLPNNTSLKLDNEAILYHVNNSTNNMFIVPSGMNFSITGGTINGNKDNQIFSRCIIQSLGLINGSVLTVDNVKFIGTKAAAIIAYEFGGTLNVTNCLFKDMAEHDGILQHATCAVTVQSGEEGARGALRFNHNYLIGTTTPALAGGSPGGVFFAPTTDYVGGLGNFSTFEAIGNYFYAIGQNCGGNDISPLHTYPVTYAARFIGNYFEKCGFSAISAKSVVDFVCEGNVAVDGQISTQNDPTSGVIYYTPGDHAASNSRPRAIISNNIVDNPGGTATVKQNGISVIGTSLSYADEVIISNNIVNNAGIGIWLDYVRDITLDNNRITGATTGVSGTESGIVPNHVIGVMRVRGNHINVSNGYGFCSINGNGTATLLFDHNYIKHTHATTYALLARGSAYEIFKDNFIDATTLAVSITTDSINDVGKLSWDRSNIVVGEGIVSIDYSHITSFAGNVQIIDYVPQQISSVTGFWDSGYGITKSSNKVSSWLDRVGGYAFIQNTSNNQPTVYNTIFGTNRPAIRFDGTTSYISSNTTLNTVLTGATSYVYLIIKPISAVRNVATIYDNDGIINDPNGVWGVVMKNVSGTTPTLYGINHGASFDNTGISTFSLGKPIIFSFRHISGKIDVRINAGAWTGNISSTDTTPLTGGIRVGGGYDNAHFGNFDLGSIIIANNTISSSDDYRILRWAQQEFGISF